MFWKASKRERDESDDEHFGVGLYRALRGRSHRLAKLSRSGRRGDQHGLCCVAGRHAASPRPDADDSRYLPEAAASSASLRRRRRGERHRCSASCRPRSHGRRDHEHSRGAPHAWPASRGEMRSAIALAPRAAAPRSALILLLEEDLRAAGGNIPLEQWAELENLWRKSVIATPRLAAPRLALAACLRQEARYREAQTAPARVVAPRLRVEAENLLREAVAEEPRQAAPHLALAEFLLENLRYAEAETVAVAALQRCPASAELRLVLARIQHQLLRRENAKKTIEALIAIAPENAWAWFEYGKILWNSFEPADGAFERAADVSGNDIALLAAVARHFLYDLDYEKAAKYYERLLDLHPSMWDNFVICGQYAICLKKIARAQEAAQIVATALDRCRLAAERAKGEGLELIKREEALLL